LVLQVLVLQVLVLHCLASPWQQPLADSAQLLVSLRQRQEINCPAASPTSAKLDFLPGNLPP